MKALKLCLQGIYLILQSLSGTFALITLLVIAAVTWHSPTVGGVALAAFTSIVPAILAYAEHKECLANLPTKGQI